jgi:putative heme-binding domain-containing protein
MMAKLYPLDFSSLSETNQLALLRAYSLSISRMGSVSESSRNEIIKQLDSHYPNKLKFVNHELSRLLCHLEAKDVISKTLAIMHSAEKESANDQIKELSRRSWKYGKALNNLISETPQTQQIHYARMLTQVKNGWTFAERQQYLSWYKSALSKKGGNSYSGHISNMQKVAIGHIPATERKAFEALIKNPNSAVDLSKLPKAKGPGKAWTIAQVVELEKGNGLKYRNFNNGKKMFAAALCSSCHRFAGEGNSAGPDLTGLGKRFDTTSIMEAIIAPSKFISDQYSTTVITTKDKSVYNGRIKQEEDGIIQLLVNPYDSSMVSEIESKDVTNRDISKVSLMPPGLIYSLNEDELLDLLAYLKSGGNAEHQYFKK